MPEDEVKLRFQQTGAEDAAKAVAKLHGEIAKAAAAAQQTEQAFLKWRQAGEKAFDKAQVKHLEDLRERIARARTEGQGMGNVFDSLQKALGGMSASLKTGGANTGLFSAALDTLNQGVTILRNPFTAVIASVGAFAVTLEKATAATIRAYDEIRQLQTVTGESAAWAERVADAFDFAGVSTSTLGAALFRLGFQSESGGKGLLKLGIDVRNAAGEMKSEGALLLETRDKIAALGDSSTRSAAMLELFGRQGRALAPAFALPREEFERLLERADKYTSITPAMMEGAKRLTAAQKETAKAMGQLNAEIATSIGFDFGIVLEGWKQKFISFANAVAKERGVLATLFGLPKAEQEEARAAQAKVLMDAAEQIRKNRQEAAKPKRLTDTEAAEQIQRLNLEFEFQQKRLKGATDYESERLKLEEGAGAKALGVQMETNEELLRLENERFEKTMALHRRTLLPGGKLDPVLVEKLQREHQDRLLGIELEGNRLRLAQQAAFAEEYKRRMEDDLKVRNAVGEAYLTVLKTQQAAELAVIDLFSETRVEKLRQTYQASATAAEEYFRVREGQIAREKAALEAYAEMFPKSFQVQQEVQQKLADLAGQRTALEQETSQKLIAMRKDYLAQLKALAAEEASIGESLEQKAIARLQKRGKTKISQQDIAWETEKMGGEARTTMGAFAAGGRVSIEKLAEARSYGKQLAQMQQAGTTPSGAAAMFQAQQAAAYGGRPFAALPTAAQGQTGELQNLAQSLQTQAGLGEVSTALGRSSDAVVTRLKETEQTFVKKLDEVGAEFQGVVGRLADGVIDKVIRKLELEAARN